MKPKKIVKNWMDTFHQGDANMISELYCTDTVNLKITHKEVIGKDNNREKIYDAVYQWFVS